MWKVVEERLSIGNETEIGVLGSIRHELGRANSAHVGEGESI